MKAILLYIWNSEAAHLFILGLLVRAVASLEAPTKDSSIYYRNFFRISNAIALQWERINPQIENSPNWNDAVDKVKNGNGGANVKPKNPLQLS